MLRTYKNNVKQDFLRDFQGYRGYGIPICDGVVPLQIFGAYSEENTISSVVLKRIDARDEVLETITLNVNIIKYYLDQYVVDNTKLYNVAITEGVYFMEFADGVNIFRTQIFKIEPINHVYLASSALVSSNDKPITDVYEVQ